MTHADIIAAFLHKIIAHPADDGPRLVMADWCEEHGQGERAEFIRVACELANSPSIHDVHRLERRAYELLTQHEPDWVGEFMPDARWTYFESDRSFTFQIFHWYRGFVRQVECTLETFRGRTCKRCGGDGKAHGSDRPFEWTPDAKAYLCPTCHGVGRTGGIGPQLVRRAPVESVVVTDKQPFGINELSWYDINRLNSTGTHPQSDLPTDLYAALEGEDKRGKFYPSADAANAALSTALLQEARETPLTDVKEKVYS